MYGNDMVLCTKLEEALKMKARHFVEVCKESALKFNEYKSKVMVLEGKEGSVCEIILDGRLLEHAS